MSILLLHRRRLVLECLLFETGLVLVATVGLPLGARDSPGADFNSLQRGLRLLVIGFGEAPGNPSKAMEGLSAL